MAPTALLALGALRDDWDEVDTSFDALTDESRPDRDLIDEAAG